MALLPTCLRDGSGDPSGRRIYAPAALVGVYRCFVLTMFYDVARAVTARVRRAVSVFTVRLNMFVGAVLMSVGLSLFVRVVYSFLSAPVPTFVVCDLVYVCRKPCACVLLHLSGLTLSRSRVLSVVWAVLESIVVTRLLVSLWL